ncbi:hypothetical protein KR054_009030, partial [Drosophila jambulina]
MQPLLLVVLALCAAPIFGLPRPDYTDDYSDEEVKPWQPEPLKPAPWQAEPRSPPPPPPPAEPQAAVVPIPGIGQIVGVRNYKTIAGRPINAFLGVRYGKVGSGLGRFQEAQPSNLQGRIDATVQSPNCAQFPELQRLRESESRGENVDDCLTLNIYAPEGAKDLPVLVFAHGEMLFDGGAEEAQPDYVLEKDVLLVSINYRLAPFGFLSALSDELPGNVALSDLKLALEWLQRNLVHFGGNPGQVTLVGQAGGATLVHALSLSGRASDLFQQLILQSGTALNPYLIDKRPLETLDTFARLARCPTNPAARSLAPLYDCLAALPTSQLVSAFEQLFEQNEPRGLSSLGGFKLVVGDRLGYLPRHPAALAANSSNSVPTIVGAAKDASAFILSRFYNQIAGLQSHNVSDYIDVVLRHTAPPSEHRIWKQWALREIFTPDQEYSASARTVTQGLLELSNIILYRAPVIFSIRQSYRSSPVYLYTFDYRGEHHRFGHLNNPLPFGVDASLSDDSVYLFPYPEEASRLNPVDRSLSRALVTMWVNFAVTGVPNPNAGVWPRATSEYGPFLRFTNSRQSMLELDPHFGEGINLPHLYGEYFNATTSSSSTPAVAAPTRPYTYPTYPPTTTTTSTTTTTTRRPYAYNPYANWQNRQPQQTWRPANPEYVRAQEERQAQFIRDQQLRAQREREQRWREQQQRDNQNRRPSQDPREQQRPGYEQQQREKEQQEQQRREQILRAQQQREREERERQQREQQEREQQEQQQEREQQEREQREREQREREQQEREQREREQQEREQQEREQQEREQQERENPNNELQPYPNYDDYLRNHQEESPESTPDRGYDDEQENEQQRREQQQREQEERLEEERLQQEREQQERERQQAENPDDDRQAYPSYEDYLRAQQGENPPDTEQERNYNEEQDREQQQREQQEREQQEREQQEREQQEREQPEREQQEREPQPDSDDPRNYASYDEYLRAHQARQPAESDFDAEEQDREQERRDQLDQEQGENPEENPEDTDDQEPTDPANDPSSYPSYEDYVRAQQKMREEEEERDRALEARERAEEEQEESRQEYPGYSQLR